MWLRDGWDITFGSNPGTSLATLGYGYATGEVYEAVLWVRAKTGSATTTVDVYLLEPYE